MELFSEEELLIKPKKKKTIKPTTLIIVAIVLLTILLLVTIVAIIYFRGTILTIEVDDRTANELHKILVFEENNKVYMPIRRMAEYLNYDSFNGDYITKSEDANKCYIEAEEELVSFTLESNVLTKVVEGQTHQVKISEPIKEINGELCVTSEGARDAFNLIFYYDLDKNKIYIQTLPYLYIAYSQYFVNKGYLPIEEETFDNKIAILDDMLIVKNENNNYGVININGETILEAKYDKIDYLQKTAAFLVESNGKKGIISINKETKVPMTYDSIEMITNKSDIFYVVGKSNLYGLLDLNGKPIIYPEYEQIGMDVTDYEKNGVTNGYILYNEIIPVKRNNKWALFDIQGNRKTEFIYDSLGCPKTQNVGVVTYGVIEVMDYNLIVAAQGEKYNLIDLQGNGIFNGFILDSVYITVSEGQPIYYITSGTVTKELVTFLQEKGIEKPTPIQ